MYAKYYERKRNTGLTDKPILESIFILKRSARQDGKGVKTLLLTEDEFETLQEEVKAVGRDINFPNLVNDQETISKLLGVDIEVLAEIKDVNTKVA